MARKHTHKTPKTPKVVIPSIPDEAMDCILSSTQKLISEFGMTMKDLDARDGKKNLRTARALKRLSDMQLLFSGEEHGADAWIVRGTVLEELEMKSALEGNDFCFYTDKSRETPVLLQRLSTTSFVFSVYRRNEELVEVYYLPIGTGLTGLFRERYDIVMSGGERTRKQFSLKTIKEFGAIKLI